MSVCFNILEPTTSGFPAECGHSESCGRVKKKKVQTHLSSMPNDELMQLWSIFSYQLIPPRCAKERFGCSFVPPAIRPDEWLHFRSTFLVLELLKALFTGMILHFISLGGPNWNRTPNPGSISAILRAPEHSTH